MKMYQSCKKFLSKLFFHNKKSQTSISPKKADEETTFGTKKQNNDIITCIQEELLDVNVQVEEKPKEESSLFSMGDVNDILQEYGVAEPSIDEDMQMELDELLFEEEEIKEEKTDLFFLDIQMELLKFFPMKNKYNLNVSVIDSDNVEEDISAIFCVSEDDTDESVDLSAILEQELVSY
jgi:hypothetical protein